MALLWLQYSNRYLKQTVDVLILSHFPYREEASVLLIHLGAFDFLNGRFGKQVFKQILEEGLRHPLFCHTSLKANKLVLFFNSPWGFPDRGHSPWAPPKGSETGLKPLGNTFRLTISESLLLRLQHHCFISFFSCRNDVLIFLFWFHCRSIKFSLFSRKRAKPRERPQKGLKPVWNHSETPSGSPSQNLCFFGYSIIALFRFLVAGMMCWFFCFGFIAGALSSASFLGKEQSPVSAPKRVWNRSETTLKHPLLTIYNALSLLSLFLSLSLSLSLAFCLSPSVSRAILFSGPLHVFPDRNVYS